MSSYLASFRFLPARLWALGTEEEEYERRIDLGAREWSVKCACEELLRPRIRGDSPSRSTNFLHVWLVSPVALVGVASIGNGFSASKTVCILRGSDKSLNCGPGLLALSFDILLLGPLIDSFAENVAFSRVLVESNFPPWLALASTSF